MANDTKVIIERGKKPRRVNLTDEEQAQRDKDKIADDIRIAESKVISARNIERGPIAKQLEYIVENGIEAFIDRDNAIRAKHPKPKKKANKKPKK